MKTLGTQHTRTAGYHPIANGLVERLHGQLKAAIKCLPNPNEWISGLTWILLGIRTGFKEDIGCSMQNFSMAKLYVSQGNWSFIILRLYQTQSLMLQHYGLLCNQSRLYLRNQTHIHHISLMLISQIHTFLYDMMQFVHHCRIHMMDRSKLLREGINPLNSSLMGDMSMCQLFDLNQHS